MFRTTCYQIGPQQEAYQSLDHFAHLANNLRNAVLFRLRQVMTGMKKENPTPNEQAVLDEIAKWFPVMNDVRHQANENKYQKYQEAVKENLALPPEERKDIKAPSYSADFVMPTPKKWMLSYEFVEALLKVSQNPDYDALPAQAAQNVVRSVCREFKSYFAKLKKYKKAPSRFTGIPKLPRYGKKGGIHSFSFTNQDCRIRDGFLLFPKTDAAIKSGNREGKLKQVDVSWYHGVYKVCAVFQTEDIPQPEVHPRKIFSVDIGVNNLAAITNNAGHPCYLFKGGVLKSINQKFNKDAAAIQSAQMLKTGKKFRATPEYHALCRKRKNCLEDLMHKAAARIIDLAIAGEIDTIIYGKNVFWKQGCQMGSVQTQNFVQLPFTVLEHALRDLCQAHGICFLTREESYTSQASFLDHDPIPTYGEEDVSGTVFSGVRGIPCYHGYRKEKGKFRGLYEAADGSVINADLNGSANIVRKEFPEMYTMEGASVPDFKNVVIFRHPDQACIDANRKKQKERHFALYPEGKSKAKLRRDAKRSKIRVA